MLLPPPPFCGRKLQSVFVPWPNNVLSWPRARWHGEMTCAQAHQIHNYAFNHFNAAPLSLMRPTTGWGGGGECLPTVLNAICHGAMGRFANYEHCFFTAFPCAQASALFSTSFFTLTSHLWRLPHLSVTNGVPIPTIAVQCALHTALKS